MEENYNVFLIVGKGVFDVNNVAKFLETRGIVDVYTEIQKIKKHGFMQYGRYKILAFR
jgi:hypothetical protein